MKEIIKKTELFADEIRQTDIYQKYRDLELQIKDKAGLMPRIDEFRRQSFEIQISHRYGHFNSYERIIGLKNENEDLLSEPLVKAFLDAELKLSKLLGKIYETMAEVIEFDIDFLTK
ncbi:MAG: YlbF family regulator [Vallitaleaceae bacterium]|jgi:cell fate (sporulation/competence/biofilm development) regulator YlbF (YheA/YmcA/DUF963 family)|nr:YlbF family regulator [Vallitaleaceae bacterium]